MAILSAEAEATGRELLDAFGEPAVYRRAGAPDQPLMAIIRSAPEGLKVGEMELTSESYIARISRTDVPEIATALDGYGAEDRLIAADGTIFLVNGYQKSASALWLLDEPANGLDTASIARLEALIADHRAAGGAVLVATHLPLALPDAATITLGATA